MSMLLWVLAAYIFFIWPTYLYTRRHYAYRCYSHAMAFTWPLSVSFLILFEAWCLIDEFRCRNEAALEVTKGCPPVVIPSEKTDTGVHSALEDTHISAERGE